MLTTTHNQWLATGTIVGTVAVAAALAVAWRSSSSYARDAQLAAASSAADPALDLVTTQAAFVGPTRQTEQPVTPEVVQALRNAIEGSLYGQLDPGAFLDAGLAVAQLEPEHAAIAVPHPTGAVRHRLQNTPTGVAAELWIRRTSNGALVLTLDVTLDAPMDPYVLEGAARTNLQAQITVWQDSQGALKNFGVLTELELSPTNRALGLWPSPNRIPEGLLYAYDAGQPLNTSVSAHGIDNGSPADWDVPAALIGGPWPRVADLEALNTELQAMYSKVSP